MRDISRMTCLLITVACGGTASKYCDKYATCVEDDCDYSEQACSAIAKGEKNSCEADVRAYQASIRSGSSEECDACIAAMDVWLVCMSQIMTCSDFFDGSYEDCDGEYNEYASACDNGTYNLCLSEDGGGAFDTR